jgi:DNA-binding NarL/FixJ family response regulator
MVLFSPQSRFLTRRDLEILDYVADGATDTEIGRRLNLSPKTINHRVEAMKRILGVNTRIQVVVTALRNKWIF